MIDRESQSIRFELKKNRKKYAAGAVLTAAAAAAGVYFGHFYTGWVGVPGTAYMYFIEKGDMKEDTWILDAAGNYRHTGKDGGMVRGRYTEDGNIYLFGKDGAMLTGWQEQEEGRMYFGADGKAARGWSSVDGGRRYFDGSGILQTGWLALGNGVYYLGSDGTARTGWQEVAAPPAHMPEGSAAPVSADRYFFDGNGVMKTGWYNDGGTWYLLSDSGKMLTGDKIVDGLLYHMDGDGKMATGWLEADGGRRYHSDSGEAVSGWQMIDGERYFFGSDFLMETGDTEIGGERFHLEEDGTVLAGWHESEDGDYYVCSDGYVLDTDAGKGDFGRLVIRTAKIDVAVYTENERDKYQEVADREDSAVAVKERRDQEYAVADRRSQGFVLDDIEEGDLAYLIGKDGSIAEYECVRKCSGQNTGKDVLDDGDKSVWKQNEGGFCTYSSAGTDDSSEIFAAFWAET